MNYDDDLPRSECGFGVEHVLTGPDVRVMKSGENHFVIACNCSEEPLSEANERPHPTDKHLGTIEGAWPSPEQWVALDDLADGWYNEDEHLPIEDERWDGTPAQRRATKREKIEKLAKDSKTNASGGADEEDEQAREVPCPNCGANAGRKCKRPSGHHVRKAHSDRKEAAREAGEIGSDDPEAGAEQAGLGEFA